MSPRGHVLRDNKRRHGGKLHGLRCDSLGFGDVGAERAEWDAQHIREGLKD